MAKAQEYVIGILFSRENRTEVEFVIGVSNETKTATWEPGKKGTGVFKILRTGFSLWVGISRLRSNRNVKTGLS